MGTQSMNSHPSQLSEKEMETLGAYARGEISASDAKMELQCSRWELIDKMASANLALPRLPRERAEEMAHEALLALGAIPPTPMRSAKQ